MGFTKLRIKLLEDGRHQYEVAHESGVWASRIAEYACGTRSMPAHHQIALADALGCNPEDIVGEVEMEIDG